MSPKGGGGGGDEEEIDLSEGVVVPDAPTALEIAEYDATTANLKWKGRLQFWPKHFPQGRSIPVVFFREVSRERMCCPY